MCDDNGIDFATFCCCYKKYKRTLTNYLTKILHKSHISEELTQDIFLKLFEKGYNLDPCSPQTYTFLHRVAKNQAIDYIRKANRCKRVYNNEELETTIPDDTLFNDLENSYVHGEVVSTLHETLSTFGEKEQQVFVDRVYLDKNIKQIMEELDLTYYEIKKIINSIKIKMKENYVDAFGEED